MVDKIEQIDGKTYKLTTSWDQTENHSYTITVKNAADIDDGNIIDSENNSSSFEGFVQTASGEPPVIKIPTVDGESKCFISIL